MQLGYTMYESETRKSAYRFVCLVLGAYTLPLAICSLVIHFSINILHSSFSAERGTPVRESSGHGTQAVGRGRCSGVPQINNNTIWTAIAIAVYATLSNRFCSVSYISTYI